MVTRRRRHSGGRCSLRTIGFIISQIFPPDRRLVGEATDGRKLQSLAANQRADGVSESAGEGEKRANWREAEIIGEIWLMAAADLILLDSSSSRQRGESGDAPF